KLERAGVGGSTAPGVVGSEGVAVTDLHPDGIVRVRGENWSATSLNGSVEAGQRIQVIESSGVRLGVWSEDGEIREIGNGEVPGGGLGRGVDERREGAQ
ncbi:MAG TPA: NfeD family protein, partial [Acidimicrobiia bacterium]|nr:NfeD family protein [Acidimicrobiia bacterium]